MSEIIQNNTIAVLKDVDAMLEGHFLLSSGRHSDRYFQCARLFQYPDKAASVLAPVAECIRDDIAFGKIAVDAIVGPALGGIISAYELARQLGVPAFFTERDETGNMSLRRGFSVTKGMHLIIAEDVITTGKSSLESSRVLESLGGVVVGFAAVVDRRAEGVALSLPLYTAVRVTAANWDAADCPLCRQGIPAVKPGSRYK
jgi:orotate phosphoribosyltransferase